MPYIGIILNIPSFDKEFLLQHHDHGFDLSIQLFFIESVGPMVGLGLDMGQGAVTELTWAWDLLHNSSYCST